MIWRLCLEGNIFAAFVPLKNKKSQSWGVDGYA